VNSFKANATRLTLAFFILSNSTFSIENYLQPQNIFNIAQLTKITNKKMKKISLTFALSLFAVALYAQSSYLEIVRSTIKTEKKALIAEVMQLSDEENLAFWDVYNEFDEKHYKLNTEYFAVVMDFADNFDNMSAEKATDLINRAAKFNIDEAKLEKTYLKKMMKVISPQKTVRFYQALNKIQAMIDAQMAAEVPLLESIE